jgi:hypothetical protein
MIQGAPQLLGDRTGRYQPRGVRETMLQKRCFALERVVVPRFEGGGKVADTAVLAIQPLARYQFLNISIGINRGLEHSSSEFFAILLDQHLGAMLEANDHHAAVSCRCAPTQALGIEHGDRSSAFSQYASRRDASEPRAYDDDIGA